MDQADSTEVKNQGSFQKWGWLGAAVIGFVLGALSIFTPLCLHALNDWDLDEKTTFFPTELARMVRFYYQFWLVGGIVGALLALAAVGAFQWIKARLK